MRIQAQSLASLWRQRLELHYELPFNINNLGESLDDLETTLEKQSSELKLLHEDIKPVIQKLSDELSKLEEERRTKSNDISASKEKLIPIAIALQNFSRRWTAISNAEDISDAEIEKVVASIAENDLIFNEAKSLFAKAEEYFVKIREFEKKESEQGLCKKELKEAQEQLREWQNQEKARFIVENEINRIKEEIRRFVAQEIRPLSNIINTLYLRAQGNRFINSIEARPSKEGFLEWIAELNEQGESFDKMLSLSQGQRQDLALAIFLARARSLGGTFFLDEPLAHLDDLNRVALLDTLRIIVSEKRISNPLRLVLTTASNNLLRHLREKFSLVESSNGKSALRIYNMSGNPKVGLHVLPPELVHSPNRLLKDNAVLK